MAATLTDSGELTYVSFPIVKWEKDPNDTGPDPDLYVYGKATDGSVDSDEQIVDPDWSAKALQEWLETGGNVRVQHNAQRDPAGKGIEVNIGNDGHYVKSLIVEPVAKRLVEKGVLQAYSVGIARPKIVRDAVARGGRIVGGPDTSIVEISLVDRPANKNCGIQLVKAADNGEPEWVGKMFGNTTTEDLLTAQPATGPGSGGEADDMVQLSIKGSMFSPADMAKLLRHREIAEKREADQAEKRDVDPNVGGGTDRDKIPAADFAGRDRSFPIVTPQDAHDAALSIGRAGEGNYSSDELRRRITSIAHRKGPEFVARLPESWQDGSKSESSPQTAKGCGCCDQCTCDHGDATKAEPYSKRPGETIECPECHKFNSPDAKYCDQCGNKLGSATKSDDTEAAKVETTKAKKTKKPKNGKPAFPGAHPPFDEEHQDSGDSDDTATKGRKDCPKCGKSYDADSPASNCEKCGTDLPEVGKTTDGPDSTKNRKDCARCGKGMAAEDRYCSTCGKQSGPVVRKAGKPTPASAANPVGHGSDMKPVPEHREPDGTAVENFEHDAGLPTDPDIKTASRLKSLGVPTDLGALHDLTCPAYQPSDATKCHPDHKINDLDIAGWQAKALDAAVSAPLEEAQRVTRLWQIAVTLKGMDDELIDQVRDATHKAFQDANPGPGSFPNPTEMGPGRFKRPYISAGHAAPSPGHDGPNTARVPNSDMSAAGYNRGPLTGGHAAPSPSNKAIEPVHPAPLPPGMERVQYQNVQAESARSAMAAMHDHVAQTFPDICAMSGPGTHGEPPTGARPVPVPAGANKADSLTPAAEQPVPTTKKNKKNKRKNDSAVTKAATLELETVPTDPSASKPATGGGLDVAELVAKIRAEVGAEFASQIDTVTKALADERERTDKLQATVDALADLPDPATAAFKGVAQVPNTQLANKASSGLPAGARTVAESAEQTQLAMMNAMREQAYTSPDPAVREAAFEQLYKMAGLPTHR